jgi:hypothetical protein
MTRLSTVEDIFRMGYTEVSRIFNHISRFICSHHHLLLFDNLSYFEPRFQMYSDAIILKVHQQNPGVVIPQWVHDICGFVDGTR